jgi:hypothetical protein
MTLKDLVRITHMSRYSVYLLYWYKSTNTDAEGAGSMLYSICGVGWGIAGKMAEDSESMRALYG